ncbi:cytochrome c oxidase assembly factor CtaG/putative copper export protein [Arthrobacter globiformis]|uniref:cytochrome c oxidase assembly protein n=1 Tax=Arthrobacter globiformis TaxID=1665 RepID=UPI0027831438|nr:cytochrome c oxidase assembly protein [Arthrobacter globiformis]MDQ1057840.1 cytochrome c oxidase assembly factor CtaG/putative copper export protein [Arthrobacter globiformis]
MKKSRTKPVAVAAVILGCGLLALFVAYSTEAGKEAALLDRTGAAVIWGLPVTKLVFNVAAAGTVGPLILALFALPPKGKAFSKALVLAGISAVLWTAAAAAISVLTFHSLANLPLFSEGSGPIFVSFLTDVDAGRRNALTVVITATVALLCFGVQSQRTVAVTAVLASTGLVPLALNSHAAGGASHADSTVSVVMHMAAAAVWIGGLATLVLLRRTLGTELLAAVRRYSTLALLSFLALAISGIAAGVTGIGTLDGLATQYGLILLAKTAILGVLGVFGALHRKWILTKLESAPGRAGTTFSALAVAELAVMAAASGLAAALARTPPPTVSQATPAPVSLRLPGFVEVLGSWKPDALWIFLCAGALFLYAAGVRRVRNRGGYWPAYRAGLWVAGVALLFLVTNGGLRVYQEYLISAHVTTQMLLIAVVPLLLVPGAPLTLVRLAAAPRQDGTIGGAEALTLMLRPVMSTTSSAPYVAAAGLAAVLAALYYTPLLEYSSRTQFGYQAMALLALLSGCLFTASLARPTDGGPGSSLASRLVTIGAVAALYAAHGWALAQQTDQLPDSRRQEWLITVGQPWDQPVLAVVEPAGMAMWIIAAGTLLAVAVTEVSKSRRRRDPGARHRSATERAHDLVMSSET